MIDRAPRRLPAFLLWAAFAALILVGADRMLNACDLGALSLFGRSSCAAAPIDPQLQREAARRDILRANLHSVQMRLAQLPLCPPPTRPPAPVSPPKPIKPPEPAKLSPPPKQEEKLTIPKRVEDLQGCWRSARGDIVIYHVDDPERKPAGTARFCYCFGTDGQGTARVRFDIGDVCTAPLSAQLTSDTLVMLHEKAACKNNPDRTFARQKIVCANTERGDTTCTSLSEGKYSVKRVEQYIRVPEEECTW